MKRDAFNRRLLRPWGKATLLKFWDVSNAELTARLSDGQTQLRMKEKKKAFLVNDVG